MLRVFLAGLFVIAGCGEPKLDYVEVKRIDEPVTPAELQALVRIAKALPEERIPDLPAVFAPKPKWDPSRTLAVSELVKSERLALVERWSLQTIKENWESNRDLMRLLRKERMTLEQFVGLTLTIGVAASRVRTVDEDRLKTIVDLADEPVRKLLADVRPFSELSAEQQYDVVRAATWLTRKDRAEHLLLVPEANLSLVRKFAEELDQVLPKQFLTDPIADVVDPLDAQGMPFLEPAGAASDADLTWFRDEAIIGRDRP